MRIVIALLACAGALSAQYLSINGPVFSGVSPPVLLTHTIFACSGGACTSGAIDSRGANAIVVTVSCNCGNDVGLGGKFTFTDSASNAVWLAGPVVFPAGNNIIVQSIYIFSPTTSATHTFTYTNINSASHSEIAVSAWSGIQRVTSFVTNSSTSTLTLQPGSTTPDSFSATITGVGFIVTSGTAPTIDTGFSITDSAAYSVNNYPTAMGYLVGSGSSVNPTWTTTTGSANNAAAWGGVFTSAAGTPASSS